MGYTPPQLEVRKISGGWGVYAPTGTTGDDLSIYPNTTDTYSSIVIYGATGGIKLQTVAGAYLSHFNAGSEVLRIYYSTPDQIIECPVDAKNIYLKTTGTGKVKFGTKTGTGDVAVDGYVSILDSAGNAVKLATVA